MKKLFYTFILLSTIGGYFGQTWAAEDQASTAQGLDRQFREMVAALHDPEAYGQHLVEEHVRGPSLEEQVEALQTIIGNPGFDANMNDEYNRTPLMLTLKHLATDTSSRFSSQLAKISFSLIPKTEHINTAEAESKSTALHLAVEALHHHADSRILAVLVARPQIDILQKDAHGQTAYKLSKKCNLPPFISNFLYQWDYYQNAQRAPAKKQAIINAIQAAQESTPNEIARLIATFVCKKYLATTPPTLIDFYRTS